jgi:hypothetical protein
LGEITFRLVTKPLIFNHQNNARGVETNVDIVELWSAFQSDDGRIALALALLDKKRDPMAQRLEPIALHGDRLAFNDGGEVFSLDALERVVAVGSAARRLEFGID